MALMYLKMPLRPCLLGCGSFLSSDNNQERRRPCLDIQHAEHSFADGSCPHCECTTMATLQLHHDFLKGEVVDPSVP